MRERINKDAFLSGFAQIIETNFKKKILKEILSFSSEISLDTIANLLLLKKKDDALDMVVDLIKKEKVPAIIDDIEGVVIVKEKNPVNEILEKSKEIMKNNLKDLINYSLNKNVRHRLSSKKYSQMENIERKQLGDSDFEMGGIGMDIGTAIRMGIMG